MSSCQSTPRLLRELKEAHENLLCATRELDRLSLGPPPSEEALRRARLKLSKASLTKRLLWGRVLARLAPDATADAECSLRQIQEADICLIKAAVEHVAAWNTPNAISKWCEYSSATFEFLRHIQGAVAEEKRLLYPLLEERASETAN